MDHQYEIRYRNISLRPLKASDIEALRNWRNDQANTAYLRKIPYITREMQEQWYKKYLDNGNEMTFGIFEEGVLHRMVGSLSLLNPEHEKIELGKILVGDKEAHGMKVGANATKAATLIAHNSLGKKTVYLYVYEQNIAAIKAYSEAGFVEVDRHVDDQGRVELVMQINCSDLEEIRDA